MLIFDPELHRYTLDGRPLPSVTRVLADLLPYRGIFDPWYLERGRAVHACAALVAASKTFNHDPQINGQVEALKRFWQDMNIVPVAVEQPVCSHRYRYAGTPDLIAYFGERLAVIDYKGSIPLSVPYQLVAYAMAWAETTGQPGPAVGYAVAIRADGTYRLEKPYKLKLYSNGWLALLTSYHIRRECGINQPDEGATYD